MNPQVGIAFFDFDGTISSSDSLVEFIKFYAGRKKFYLAFFLMSPFILLYFVGFYPNNKLKELIFTYFFKGKDEKEVKEKGIVFCEKILPHALKQSSLEKINWHQKQEHEIYIITASSAIWLKPWCDKNNFKLISTEFEVKNNIFTGKIQGKNCHGREKKRRVQEILEQSKTTQSFGYGNEKSDLAFMQICSNWEMLD
ncbi:MAG: HAD family hydrolase [Flavobacteriia bacterium]|jgi:phosphatidylglycerophosphatase C